jgi:radical SAM superfamily enzyme with C-terminal helix-hairpin-helix motif
MFKVVPQGLVLRKIWFRGDTPQDFVLRGIRSYRIFVPQRLDSAGNEHLQDFVSWGIRSAEQLCYKKYSTLLYS